MEASTRNQIMSYIICNSHDHRGEDQESREWGSSGLARQMASPTSNKLGCQNKASCGFPVLYTGFGLLWQKEDDHACHHLQPIGSYWNRMIIYVAPGGLIIMQEIRCSRQMI
ncbi:hypothetical protein M378DRAFT_155129 [Amanita muscaria Koide BX008]|uniref:Uncharacterized protein n=1 Tax=Amanita muscaria (strain Koide BX008) TaxID=946122 RepID=A0A0C2XAW6_AMAMK|nr:hypothetical protein M378DRAFT_155129 [Amanita muscaria Koide BX008]